MALQTADSVVSAPEGMPVVTVPLPGSTLVAALLCVGAIRSRRPRSSAAALFQIGLPSEVAGTEIWRLPFRRYRCHQKGTASTASRCGRCPSADIVAVRCCRRRGLEAALLQMLLHKGCRRRCLATALLQILLPSDVPASWLAAAFLQISLPSEVAGVQVSRLPFCRYCCHQSCRRRGLAAARLQALWPPEVAGVEGRRLPFCRWILAPEVAGVEGRRFPLCGRRCHHKLPASRFGDCPAAATGAIRSCRRRSSATALLLTSLPPEVGCVEVGRLPFCTYCCHQKLPASRFGGCPSAVTGAIKGCRRRGSAAASLQIFLPSEGACVEVCGSAPAANVATEGAGVEFAGVQFGGFPCSYRCPLGRLAGRGPCVTCRERDRPRPLWLLFVEFVTMDLITARAAGAGLLRLVHGLRFYPPLRRAHHGSQGRRLRPAYQSCTSTHTCTSDGSDIACRASLPMQDLEVEQFHPTGIFPNGCWRTEGCGARVASCARARVSPSWPATPPAANGWASHDVASRAGISGNREGRGIGHNKGHRYPHLDHLASESWWSACRASLGRQRCSQRRIHRRPCGGGALGARARA